MKNSKPVFVAIGTICFALFTGCQKEEAAAPTPPPADKATDPSAAQPAEAAAPSAESVTATLESTAETVKEEAAAAVKEATSQAQEKAQALIDEAKNLVEQTNYSGALAKIQELANFELTAEQKKIVDDLKATLQKAMTEKAATDAATEAQKSLDGVVPKK